jgi:hypothetical protein
MHYNGSEINTNIQYQYLHAHYNGTEINTNIQDQYLHVRYNNKLHSLAEM